MTTNHIDQLTEWWENAEEGIPSAGDTVIFDERHRGLGFHVTQATTDHPRGYDNARILTRAPKPKPAWHDAAAVIAHKEGEHGPTRREVFMRCDGDEWESVEYCAYTAELIDPVPLIEAKITNEMVERGAQASTRAGVRYLHPSEVREVLTAALGLETR